MLTIEIPDRKIFEETTNGEGVFHTIKGQTIRLEHSLVSISKWESKYEKPFLSKDKKTRKETIDYIRYMTISQNVNPEHYNSMGQDIIKQVSDYIEASMTATTFNDKESKSKVNNEIITSEVIYYWMVALEIPFECQKWHLNRLLTLINVCNIKNQPKKKMSRQEILARNRALNDARRKKLGTTG